VAVRSDDCCCCCVVVGYAPPFTPEKFDVDWDGGLKLLLALLLLLACWCDAAGAWNVTFRPALPSHSTTPPVADAIATALETEWLLPIARPLLLLPWLWC